MVVLPCRDARARTAERRRRRSAKCPACPQQPPERPPGPACPAGAGAAEHGNMASLSVFSTPCAPGAGNSSLGMGSGEQPRARTTLVDNDAARELLNPRRVEVPALSSQEIEAAEARANPFTEPIRNNKPCATLSACEPASVACLPAICLLVQRSR